MASNLRNKFVLRHFLYYFIYLIIQAPYYIFSIYYKEDDNKDEIFFQICIVLHLSLGFIMFLIRASETNFYIYLFYCIKKPENNINSSHIVDDNSEKKKFNENITEGFLDPDQPLTVMISKTLNLEFMCCVLYGLSTIFRKGNNIQPRRTDQISSNFYLLNSDTVLKKGIDSISCNSSDVKM